MKYLAILGRQPEISIAELEALDFPLDIDRLGGTLKLAVELEAKPLEYLRKLPEGKITLGVSDYSEKATQKSATNEALKLKKILVRQGRSVRVVENHEATLSTATSLHNGLSGKNERKVELIKTDRGWYRVIGVQDIEAYAKRDQARPARDAKVGMLPPKLAQILINLCGPLKPGATILDPFCGTGVVLQEALLMGYRAYGTDINDRMVKYSKKNLEHFKFTDFKLEVGDAAAHKWSERIDAVACEGYLGKPMSEVPTEMELKEQKQECQAIILGFLKNLAGQIKENTPVVIAVPAWLREDGHYERLEILAFLDKLGYNVNNKSLEGVIYHRDGQIVARDIIILRKI
ncbi:MAG: methyltransferase domain-containing protein [Candidatus Saccharibacteria bacterium]|nr:methyltransferase domain-containing protein [Candidatus Saccharibacteria bacterium]